LTGVPPSDPCLVGLIPPSDPCLVGLIPPSDPCLVGLIPPSDPCLGNGLGGGAGLTMPDAAADGADGDGADGDDAGPAPTSRLALRVFAPTPCPSDTRVAEGPPPVALVPAVVLLSDKRGDAVTSIFGLDERGGGAGLLAAAAPSTLIAPSS
jgi:hypothetical protein